MQRPPLWIRNANLRTDQWGKTPENRARMMIETTRAVAEAIGTDRTAIRLSPANTLNDIDEGDYRESYPIVLSALNELGIAYLHIVETKDPSFTPILRQLWKGVFMLNPATPGGHRLRRGV